MPNLDRTGPNGEGPQTGRKLGIQDRNPYSPILTDPTDVNELKKSMTHKMNLGPLTVGYIPGDESKEAIKTMLQEAGAMGVSLVGAYALSKAIHSRTGRDIRRSIANAIAPTQNETIADTMGDIGQDFGERFVNVGTTIGQGLRSAGSAFRDKLLDALS